MRVDRLRPRLHSLPSPRLVAFDLVPSECLSRHPQVFGQRPAVHRLGAGARYAARARDVRAALLVGRPQVQMVLEQPPKQLPAARLQMILQLGVLRQLTLAVGCCWPSRAKMPRPRTGIAGQPPPGTRPR